MTGNFVDGQHALTIGLVNHVVEPEQVLPKALSIAHDMTDTPHYHLVLDFKRTLDATFATTLAEAYTLLPEMSRQAGRTSDEGTVSANAP